MDIYEQLQQELDALKEKELYRQLRNLVPDGKQVAFENRAMLNLSSNDYLGLACRADLRREFYSGLAKNPDDDDYALSASSSRLLTGNHPGYSALEQTLSELYNGRAALVFNSGYHANIGMLPALAGKNDFILCDKLNHASIIDGIMLAGTPYKRYAHLDYDHLEKILSEKSAAGENIFIITESVFSMDGDIADLRRLVELKKKYKAVLIVDEAHGVGVFGENGAGVCEEQGVIDDIDIIIGTFGKAFCSAGAYAIMAPVMKEYLINKMRSFIFTTALPPIVINWSRFVVEKSREMSSERTHLRKLGEILRQGLEDKNFKTAGASQIVPLIVGENVVAVKLAAKMRAAGILVFPIRPPTVPPGTARLRFSLSAALTEDEIKQVLELL
ncbi:MAG: 8-amino-7-oxononanoate synthase [Victivallaceae bacterium]